LFENRAQDFAINSKAKIARVNDIRKVAQASVYVAWSALPDAVPNSAASVHLLLTYRAVQKSKHHVQFIFFVTLILFHMPV